MIDTSNPIQVTQINQMISLTDRIPKERPTKFVILGFPKCGQISLMNYLTARYPLWNIRRDELIWRRSGVKDFEGSYWNDVKGHFRPVIILRDPVKACWSLYWYMFHGDSDNERKYMKYEDFLTTPKLEGAMGEKNPLSCYNFNKWLKRFYKYDPIIVDMEEMIKNTNFPHDNTTLENRPYIEKIYGKMPEMTYEQEKLTRELLKKEVQEHPEPCWSVDYM